MEAGNDWQYEPHKPGGQRNLGNGGRAGELFGAGRVKQCVPLCWYELLCVTMSTLGEIEGWKVLMMG